VSDCQCQVLSAKWNTKSRLSGITEALRTTTTSAMEAFICLPVLMVVQGEARSAAHRLRSFGCWSYLHPNRGQSVILTGFKSRVAYLLQGVIL
jgi:hypothetical protein